MLVMTIQRRSMIPFVCPLPSSRFLTSSWMCGAAVHHYRMMALGVAVVVVVVVVVL
jgi:hypothetical protein